MKLNMKISSLLKQLFVALALVGGLGIGAAQATTYTFSISNGLVTAPTSTFNLSQQFITNDSGSTWSLGSSSFSETGTVTAGGPISVVSYDVSTSGLKNFNFTSSASGSLVATRWSISSFDGGYTPNGDSLFTTEKSPSTYAGANTIAYTTSGAPEIDGSLAPKVGFLLGCLFLMFGRKKQNTEPMMMA